MCVSDYSTPLLVVYMPKRNACRPSVDSTLPPGSRQTKQTHKHPYVSLGNPRIMEWRAVDCPVGEKHKLEYLMCTPGVCNKEDSPDVPEW